MKMIITIRKKNHIIIYYLIMDNIVDRFNINKEIIENNYILKEKESDDNEENDKNLDLVLKKKKLIEMASKLTSIEYNEILNIIQNDNCSYSSNTNGVFINLTNVEINTINKIYSFLKFTKQKKEELKEKETYLESFKKKIEEEEISNNNNEIIKKKDLEDSKSIDSLSDNEDNTNFNEYLCFSSDDEESKKNIKK